MRYVLDLGLEFGFYGLWKDFPHLTSAPLALPVTTFFDLNYVEIGL